MDMYRAFLAVILSFIVLFGYQYLFVKPQPKQPVEQTQTQAKQAAKDKTLQKNAAPQTASDAPSQKESVPVPQQPIISAAPQQTKDAGSFADITVDTPLYTAVFSENGGGVKSFLLKKYREDNTPDSGPMQLVKTNRSEELPHIFTPFAKTRAALPAYDADKENLKLDDQADKQSLSMRAELNGLELVRTLTFDPASYAFDVTITMRNTSAHAVEISPALYQTNLPFSKTKSFSRYQFGGPAYYTTDDGLTEIKAKKLAEGPQVFRGKIQWAAYEDNYFISAAIPLTPTDRTVKAQAIGKKVITVLEDPSAVLPAGGEQTLTYKIYLGPKKLSILEATDHNLSKAVNFGWFDALARPTLWLLNFLYGYVHNYGVAIILVTIFIKLLFWPITQKGMKSMKNMQKLQPKIAKLKEKYKDDPTKMNQEMMTLYKTYKVNPLGGCLPMVIQIPVFFALYKVLLQAIELRHAPFMLWITDLSAPDRLPIGVDIPYLGGIPVLTLLMGASMFLQQKMTPSTGDPTQQKIMMMLPLIFTFMFVNFPSGLVLYWFVNNLLSILQQQLINKQTK